MRSYPKSINAFSHPFLEEMSEQDEPPTAGEADVAGPWHIEEIPALGYGLFREGESLTRGFRPAAVFPDRWLALLAAACLPGTGRDALLRLSPEPHEDGFAVMLEDRTLAGRCELFSEPLLDAMNVAVNLIRLPQSLAYLLEAAGAAALERCGALLAAARRPE